MNFWANKLGGQRQAPPITTAPMQPAYPPPQHQQYVPTQRAWWDESPQPQPMVQQPQQQFEVPRQARGARSAMTCPECGSGSYMAVAPEGPSVMMGAGRARCFDCFAGTEKYITRAGLRTFAETVGTHQEVLNAKGHWVSAEIQQFGVQPLVEISFRPGNYSKSKIRHRVRATPTHRWITLNRGEVQDLRVGDQVSFVGVNNLVGDFIPEAFIYGFGFGDGTVDSAGRARLELCGHKLEKYLGDFQDFGECSISFPPSCGGNAIITFRQQKFADWKNLPNTAQKSAEWLANWVEGYLAADGHYKKADPSVRFLDSQNSEALDLVTDLAPLAGYVVTGRSVDSTQETNFGKRKSPLERLVLRKESIFRVTDVTDLGITEEVFCAVVPAGHEFVLANGIHTGNCGYPYIQSGSGSMGIKGDGTVTAARQPHDGTSQIIPGFITHMK